MNAVVWGIGLYVFAQLIVGFLVSRYIRSEDDYLVAGRSLGYGLAIFTIFATWFGAETCIGAAGTIYEEGLSGGSADPFGYGLCLVLMGLVFAAPLWRRKLTTFGDLFRQQHGVVPGHDDDGGAEPDAAGPRREVGQQVERGGDLRAAGEVVLDDEDAVEAEPLRLDDAVDEPAVAMAVVGMGKAQPLGGFARAGRRAVSSNLGGRAAEQAELQAAFPSVVSRANSCILGYQAAVRRPNLPGRRAREYTGDSAFHESAFAERGSYMRFSLSLRPGSADPVSAKEIAEFSQLAEKLGYYAVYITDHYYITTPNLHSVGAAAVVAASTETVKIGFAAYQAPLRHPIAAAKELASLDILCNGRFICGLAAGSYEPEFKAFGIPFNRRGAMLEESVQAIKKLWTGDRVSFKGAFWSFENVTIHPKPIQKPHPPIWIATWTAVPRAART